MIEPPHGICLSYAGYRRPKPQCTFPQAGEGDQVTPLLHAWRAAGRGAPAKLTHHRAPAGQLIGVASCSNPTRFPPQSLDACRQGPRSCAGAHGTSDAHSGGLS